MTHLFRIDDLIIHTLALDDINTAFDLMHKGESVRSVIVYSNPIRITGGNHDHHPYSRPGRAQ